MIAAESPAALAIWLLRRDPVGAGLTPEHQAALAEAALADGYRVGRALADAHPGQAPEAIAAALGIRVTETGENPWSGPILRHADYRARPPEIRLFRSSIDLLERQARATLAPVFLAPVFLAHELYHHAEATRAEAPLPRQHAVARLRLGAWHLDAAILALSEIAAGACAQALLGLAYHPAALDLIVMARNDQPAR